MFKIAHISHLFEFFGGEIPDPAPSLPYHTLDRKMEKLVTQCIYLLPQKGGEEICPLWLLAAPGNSTTSLASTGCYEQKHPLFSARVLI